jgi:hypothetical protein
MIPKAFASTYTGAGPALPERKISQAQELSLKLYISSRKQRCAVGVGLVLGWLSQTPKATAAASQIHWHCPRFADDSEARAAVEARSHVELSLVSADTGSLAISCVGSTATIALRSPAADGSLLPERVVVVPLPAADEPAIDALVDAVWHLARRPPEAPPPPPVAASSPPPRPSPPAQATQAFRWEVSVGTAAHIMRGPLHGWLGPQLGAGLRTSRFGGGFGAGYGRALSRVDGLSVSTWSASAFGELHVVGPLLLGASAGALRLGVTAPRELTPASNGTWIPGLAFRARLRVDVARWAVSIGPEVHYRWLSPVIAIDDKLAFQIPRLALGVAAELSYVP